MTLCWCVNSRGARGAYLVAPGAREMSERADLASGVRGMSLDDADPSSDAASPCPRSRASPIFGLETLERNANRGGGVITTGAAADGLVVVGTTRGACVVHDLTAGAYREIDCLPLDDADRSRRELTVARIWLDPTARHAVAVLRDDDGRIVDTVYFHATFRRARPILGVRDASVVVTAVGWLADACEDDAAPATSSSAPTTVPSSRSTSTPIPRRPAPTARSAACWTARRGTPPNPSRHPDESSVATWCA